MTTYSDGYNGRSPYGDLSCCGRPVSNLQGLAEAADLLPASTRAGRRARARLALAVLERRAAARGDTAMVARVRQGLASLGDAASDARRAAVAASIATVRAGRERRDPATGEIVDQLQARRDARIGRDVESVLLLLQGAVSLADAPVQAEARGEATRAANEGREPNYSARDAGKVLAWFRWLFGGAFPSDAAESDLRLLASTYEVALPLVTVALVTGKLAAARANNTGLRDALTGIENYLASMSRTIRSAVAALPPPAAPPPAPPPGGGFVVGPTTGIRCPDGQVSTAYGCRPPCPPGTYQDRTGCVPFSRPIGPDGRPIDYVVCPDGSRASSTARCPGANGGASKSSGLVVALPAAALLWYFLK